VIRAPFGIAVGLGVVLGLFSLAGDQIPGAGPSGVLNALANAFGPWALVAFVCGALQRRWREGAVAGAAGLIVAIVAYYVGNVIVWGDRFAGVGSTAVVWLAAASVGGAVLGAAGAAWRTGDGRARVVAVALLCGALLAEAAYQFVLVEAWRGIDPDLFGAQIALFDLAVAAILPVVLLDRGQRWRAYAGSVLFGAGGAMGLALLTRLAQGAYRV
jgi:hypothetical protein